MKVILKKMSANALIPMRGSAFAAGYDLYACIAEPININPHETAKIGTGIACALPSGTFGAVFARSGLATKEGLRPANCVGVVDSDYRGEIIVALHNDGDIIRTVTPNERIAQFVLMPFIPMEFAESDELPESVRGSGGFGSTGA